MGLFMHLKLLLPASAIIAAVIGTTACTKESLNRTAYLTMKNYDEQQCKKDLNTDCPPQMEYEEYKDQLKRSGPRNGY